MATKQTGKQLLPAYAAIGSDALKRETVAGRLRARLQKMGDVSFNYEEFDGEQCSGADIVAACNTIPFASPVRMVRVKSAEKLRKADSEEVVAYLGSPSDTTVLLLEAASLSKATRLYKAIAACGSEAIIECEAPKKRDLPNLVRSMAVGHGITLTDGAARLLVELAGEDTVRLDSELGKIALAHRTTEVSVWDFLDTMSARNAKRCLLNLSLMPSASPNELLSRCISRLRELICAKTLIQRGQPRMITSALGKKDWQVKRHAEWASRFTEEELRSALLRARDAELAIKSGANKEDVFKDWLLSVLIRF